MVCSWWEARTYTTKQLKAVAIPHSFLWFSASLMFCSSFPISHSCNEGVVALEKSAELRRQTAFASPFLITNSWRPARNCLPAGQAALPTVWNGWCWPSFPAVGMPTGPSSVPRRLQVRQACWSDAAPWWLSLMPLVHRKKTAKVSGRERETWLQTRALSDLEQGLKSQSVKWACRLLEVFFHPTFPNGACTSCMQRTGTQSRAETVTKVCRRRTSVLN